MLQQTLTALKECRKGKLQYDREWLQEGRSKDVLTSVTQFKITIPKDFSFNYDEGETDKPCTGLPLKTNLTNEGYVGLSKLNNQKDCNVNKPATITTESNGNNANTEGTNIEPMVKDTESNELNSPCEVLFEGGHESCSDIVHYEAFRKKNVDDIIKDRQAKLKNLGNLYYKQISTQIDLFRETQQLNHELHMKKLMEQDEIQLKEMDLQKQEMKENEPRHAKRLGDKIKRVEQKSKELEDKHNRQMKLNEERRELLMQYYTGLQSVSKTVDDLLSKCSFPHLLHVTPMDRKKQMQSVQESLFRLLEKNESLTENDCVQTQGLLSMARSILMEVNQDVNEAHSQGQLTIENNATIPPQEIETSTFDDMDDPEEKTLVEELATNEGSSRGVHVSTTNIQPLASKDSLKNHHDVLISNHKSWENEYSSFLKDDTLKQYRFDLRKAVVTPLNASGSVSCRNLGEKINNLTALLSGRKVAVGSKKVSISNHPAAIFFCADHIALKLVHLAEVQVSSQPDDAFPLACITVSLWTQFPKLGELLLYHLYSRCPYLSPGTIALPKDKTDGNAVFKALGYLFSDNKLEEDEEFLKRMTGIVRFYCAILVSSPAPSYQSSCHPHGLRHGWQLLVKILQSTPWPDITPTFLSVFLEVCGHQMYKTYQQQFRKILFIICTEYMIILEKRDCKGESNGPLNRLNSFLAVTLRKGSISPPKGLLDANFWYR